MVRDIMVSEFGLSIAEAEGRVSDFFAYLDLTTEETELDLGHEFPRDTAYDVYYGHGSLWWLHDRAELTPLPWRPRADG